MATRQYLAKENTASMSSYAIGRISSHNPSTSGLVFRILLPTSERMFMAVVPAARNSRSDPCRLLGIGNS